MCPIIYRPSVHVYISYTAQFQCSYPLLPGLSPVGLEPAYCCSREQLTCNSGTLIELLGIVPLYTVGWMLSCVDDWVSSGIVTVSMFSLDPRLMCCCIHISSRLIVSCRDWVSHLSAGNSTVWLWYHGCIPSAWTGMWWFRTTLIRELSIISLSSAFRFKFQC